MNPGGAVLATGVTVAGGLAVGSFLTVVAHRVPAGASVVAPASHCPACLVPLRRRHLVPVASWVALRGRCADCRTAIPLRYPLLELVTAALFGVLALHFGPSLLLVAMLWFATVLLAVIVVERATRTVPEALVLAAAVGTLLLLPAGAADLAAAAPRRAAVGALALLGVWTATTHLAGHRLPTPDGVLAGIVGLHLAWVSWGALLLGTVGALVLAVAVPRAVAVCPGGGVIDTGRPVPAPPSGLCLAAAALPALVVAGPVLDWYGALVVR